MKKDDGFTLTETLVALLVISLALATVIVAASLASRFNGKVWSQAHHERQLAAVEGEIATILRAREPVRGSDLIGAGRRFDYACTPGSEGLPDCHFALNESAITGLHFVYVGEGKARPDWPPEPKDTDMDPTRLEAVILQDEHNKTVALIRLDVEQPKDCAFDMISRTCRAPENAGPIGQTSSETAP